MTQYPQDAMKVSLPVQEDSVEANPKIETHIPLVPELPFFQKYMSLISLRSDHQDGL